MAVNDYPAQSGSGPKMLSPYALLTLAFRFGSWYSAATYVAER